MPGVRLLLVLVLSVACLPASSSEVEQHVHDQYQGKIFLLRGFPSGAKLDYDVSGAPLGTSATGLWTTDAFVLIEDARVDGQNLIIKGRRMLVVSQGKGFQFVADTPKRRKKAPVIEIEAAIGSDAGVSEVDALLTKVFLTDYDSLAALVPQYWQTCLSAGLNQVNDPKFAGCLFSAEMLRIPGVNAHPGPGTSIREDQANSAKTESVRVYPLSKGISPPIPIYKPDPQFIREDQALGFAGAVTLSLIVDEKGIPRNIEILRPLGGGLDEETMRTVSTWKFEPAKKDGQPVAIQVEVQVQFHSY